jgi:hypothetical protein
VDELICLPCIKSLVNEGARSSNNKSHMIATALPALVKAGRISGAKADEIYKDLIDLDEVYSAGVEAVVKKFATSVAPEWTSE